MATINRPQSGVMEELRWYLQNKEHSVWDSFSTDDQRHLVEDDLKAGKSVALLLGSLVTAGMLMAIVTLLLVLATS